MNEYASKLGTVYTAFCALVFSSPHVAEDEEPRKNMETTRRSTMSYFEDSEALDGCGSHGI